MPKNITKQLLSDARRGIISYDELLCVCLERLESISEVDLYQMALDEGFIQVQRVEQEEDKFEAELNKLDATQRIIEKVLRRYGE